MKHIPLVIVVFIGFILRFAFLGEVPLSMHRDETFFGYNAYSIVKTGKDISGETLPLHLESFFMSPAGYSYLVVPALLIFDLSDFAVRLPSALFGVLSIVLIYLVCSELFRKYSRKSILSLFSSFIFAISPWHINLSRVATENVVVTFFILLGVYLFLLYTRKKRNLILVLSFVSFSLTLILYQAPRSFLPLFLPALFITFESVKKIFKFKIEYLFYIILIVLPVLLILTSKDLSWRITSLSIFSHEETKLVLNEQLTTDSVQGLPYLISRIFHNKIIAFALLISENFFKHLSFDFLFQDGGFPDRYRIPRMGLLHIVELPFLLFGLFFMFKKNLKTAAFLGIWIAFGLLGSALTSDDVPNLQRTLLILPALSIFIAYGALGVYEFIKLKNKKIQFLVVALAAFFIFFSLSYYLVQYYFQGKVYRTWYRQDGYKEMVIKVNSLVNNYKYAQVTDRESTPAIFFMYYGYYDPSTLQKETKDLDMRGAGDIPFGKYIFTNEECPVRYEIGISGEEILVGEEGVLYVNSGLCRNIPKEAKIIENVKRADGSTAFVILAL